MFFPIILIEFGATKSVRIQWLPGSHREYHLHLGLACIARCIWAFVVHRHYSFGSTGPLSIINHMATQIKQKYLLCTLHLFISSCVQHFERSKHEDHFPYLHIGCGAYEAPAPYPVLQPCRNLRRDLRHRAQHLLVANRNMSKTTSCLALTTPWPGTRSGESVWFCTPDAWRSRAGQKKSEWMS